MEFKVIGAVILSGSEIPFEVYQVGKDKVKALDKAIIQTGEVLLTVTYEDGRKQFYILAATNIITELEEAKITTAGIENFLPK